MTYYVGILDAGPNGAWGVRIPDVPGCHGGGDTPEAAIADVTGALRELAALYAANGVALPPPREALEIVRDKEVAIDPGIGETLVMIPLILDRRRPVRANISLDAGTLEAIDDAAERSGLTRSAFLASAALDKIDSKDTRYGSRQQRSAAKSRARMKGGKLMMSRDAKSGTLLDQKAGNKTSRSARSTASRKPRASKQTPKRH